MGWRERANLLRWLLSTGLANKDNYEKIFKNFLEKTRYDYNKDYLVINKEIKVKCIAGWQCIEIWIKFGLKDNPEILNDV
jgi:hypothetical protein